MFYPSNILDERSRVWIYQTDRALNPEEKAILVAEMKTFIESWTAHSKDLKGSFEFLYDRFLIIMIDESNAAATGCSLDKCMHFIQKMEKQLNISLTNRLLLAYRENDEIKLLSKSSFEEKLKAGQITPDTIVFNNLISKKSELKTNWQVPVKESWHRVML
jgi:hypothetical protein